ncbi:MAG TPA: N-acetylmuramoyl-L-alanine amidase [Acidimicrobiia bacterium]|nr:N-acetylmuramoyl-L-alanine amidase [Acidimicrobiia bacterium]
MSEHDVQHECPGCVPAVSARPSASLVTRRQALKLGAAGAAVAVAPRVLGGFAPVLESRLIDLSDATRTVYKNKAWPPPPIITRQQWGANEALRKSGQEYDWKVEKLVVHHTVTPNNPSDPAAIMRNLYTYALNSGYIDLPYHWLIDHRGRIFEGRWATDYPPGAPHTGEKDGRNVRGGHALNHNTRTIGIALMGTYTTIMPPQAMIDALVTLLTWKCARWGIDPRGSSTYYNAAGQWVSPPNICGHRDTKATACPGGPLYAALPTLRDKVAVRLRGGTTGYWIVGADGRVYSYGDMPVISDLPTLGITDTVRGARMHPNGRGFWLLGRSGGVYAFGTAAYYGRPGAATGGFPVVAIESTKSGAGYWLVDAGGGVHPYGDAADHGSMRGTRLNRPIVGITRTPSGAGYWLVASDGGIFSFGDAAFRGSTGNLVLDKPIIGMAATPTGAGYWMLASDGGIFSFGDAAFFGSGAPTGLRFVGMIPTSTGRGYALLASDGRVVAFGDAPRYGDAAGKVTAAAFAGRLVP